MRPADVIRPRFDVELEASPDQALRRIRDYLDREDFGCRGWVAPPYAELEVQAATRSFWSPRLAVYAEDVGEGCRLACRFQPEPNVWTLYMAAWGVWAVLSACSVAWVCARLIMGDGLQAPLWCVGLSVLVGAALLVSARIGRGLGSDQMHDLQAALYAALRPGSRRRGRKRLTSERWTARR